MLAISHLLPEIDSMLWCVVFVPANHTTAPKDLSDAPYGLKAFFYCDLDR